MILKDYLLSEGFKQKLPWQFECDSYWVIKLQDDSFGNEIWGISNKRFDERVFRGRIRSVEEFKLVFELVKEDYDL